MDISTQIALQIAEKVRAEATKTGQIPFRTGDLRKSIQANIEGVGAASVGSNLPYARAVHDGRGPLTIRPNIQKNPPRGERKKYHSKSWYQQNPERARLRFVIGGRIIYAREVHQPARKGQPFLTHAINRVKKGGFDFLNDLLTRHYAPKVVHQIKKNIEVNLT
jgi:phage gpG-like protein